jgi:hypothetical protein
MEELMKSTLTKLAAAAVLIGSQLQAADPIVSWNQFATAQTLVASDPVSETRVFAILHIAIHDAVNSIDRKYEPYSYSAEYRDASAEAAVAAAAREVLVNLIPTRRNDVETAYAQAIGFVPPGTARDRGIEAGRRAAQQILQLRTGDGSERNVTIPAGTKPGEYRPTAPDFTPAFLPAWGEVKPFAMKNGSQFRPDKPHKLDSAAYLADFNEVKAIGEEKSATRTTEQSEIAKYWYEGSGQGWNRIARAVADGKGLNLWESARLFALVNIAMADGFIGGFEAKYHYNFWRPITAIREDVQDDWNAFLPTPPVPDYPSTHSVLGGAAARAMALFFGSDFVSFQMTSGAPFAGVTRKFWSFSEAAEENAASRVLAGIHFRTATRAGVRQGEQIADYAFETLLRPAK